MSDINEASSEIQIPDELINWGNGWGRPNERTKTIIQKVYEYLVSDPESPWKAEAVFDQDDMCILVLIHPMLGKYSIYADTYDQRYEVIDRGFTLEEGKLISEKCQVWAHSEDYHDIIHFNSPDDGDYIKWVVNWLRLKDVVGTSKVEKNLKEIGDFIFAYIQDFNPSWNIIYKKLHEQTRSDFDERLQLVYEARIKNNKKEEFKVNIILREHYFDEYGKKRAEKCDFSIDQITETRDMRMYVNFDCVNHLNTINWAVNWLSQMEATNGQ